MLPAFIGPRVEPLDPLMVLTVLISQIVDDTAVF